MVLANYCSFSAARKYPNMKFDFDTTLNPCMLFSHHLITFMTVHFDSFMFFNIALSFVRFFFLFCCDIAKLITMKVDFFCRSLNSRLCQISILL